MNNDVKIDRENLNRLYGLLADMPREDLWEQILYQAQNRYTIAYDENLVFYINAVIKDKIEIVEDATL